MNVHNGNFGDDHWLLLVEDSGPDGLGRVLGYFVFNEEDEAEAAENLRLRYLLDLLDLFPQQPTPEDVTTEVLSYRDFRESYGNRMPLRYRYLNPPSR